MLGPTLDEGPGGPISQEPIWIDLKQIESLSWTMVLKGLQYGVKGVPNTRVPNTRVPNTECEHTFLVIYY